MNSPKLVIRTDGNKTVGYGHFLRCLAVAEAWIDRVGPAEFIISDSDSNLLSLLHSRSIPHDSTPPTLSPEQEVEKILNASQTNSWVFLDDYRLSEKLLPLLREARRKTAIFADAETKSNFKYARAIIDYQPEVNTSTNDRTAQSHVFLRGTRYLPLRQQFSRFVKPTSQSDSDMTVLVTLGGSEQVHLLRQILNSLGHSLPADCALIVTAAPNAIDSLNEMANSIQPDAKCRISVSTENFDFAALLGHTDIVVCGAGMTLWEAASLGVPSVSLTLAPNQREGARTAQIAGCSCSLGWYNDFDESEFTNTISQLISSSSLRAEMGAKGRELIDGRGAERVVDSLVEDLEQ